MGRLCLGAWMAASCLSVALHPVQGALRVAVAGEEPLRLPVLLSRTGLARRGLPWPRARIANEDLQTADEGEWTPKPSSQGLPYEYPEADVGEPRRSRQGRRGALGQPTEPRFVVRDQKGFRQMKRAFSLWAALHKPVGYEAIVKPVEPEGETPLRPVGVNPLRWGR